MTAKFSISGLFDKIKATSSTKEKVALLQSCPEEHLSELKVILTNTYSSEIVFEITSAGIDVNTIYASIKEEFPVNLYSQLLTTSGRNAKIDLIRKTLSGHTKSTMQYMLNSIDKDLGIGINVKLINKAFPGLIREFKLMLAAGGNKKQGTHKQTWMKHYGSLGEVYVNLKIDGLRCICELNSPDDIQFFSRDGKILSDFLVENIRRDLKDNFDKFGAGTCLDGEIYCQNFTALMKVAMRKEITSEAITIRNTCKFAIFDVIDYRGESYGPKTRLKERVELMRSFPQELSFIKFVKYTLAANDYTLLVKMAKHYISKGHEGLVVKNPYSFYEFKRSFFWLKFKNSDSLDLKIIGVEPGEKGTKYEKYLGVIILDLGDGKSVRCGSGFTDKERKELWENKENLIGQIAEIEYMEETEGGESLRHPVFRCIRTDKVTGDK